MSDVVGRNLAGHVCWTVPRNTTTMEQLVEASRIWYGRELAVGSFYWDSDITLIWQSKVLFRSTWSNVAGFQEGVRAGTTVEQFLATQAQGEHNNEFAVYLNVDAVPRRCSCCTCGRVWAGRSQWYQLTTSGAWICQQCEEQGDGRPHRAGYPDGRITV